MTKTIVKLRMTGQQHAALLPHLFPGDNKEAVALALCGVGTYSEAGVDHRVVCIHKVFLVPYELCSVRTETRLTWSTEQLPDILKEAMRRNQVILKIHSHTTGLPLFSNYDDDSDRKLFASIGGWLDTDFPGLSAIMMPNGEIVARSVGDDGSFQPVISVGVVGADIKLWYSGGEGAVPDFMVRTVQSFGGGTTQRMARLSVGVVGVSGTGSPVTEMLYRLGVSELVLVDDDIMKKENISRIYNSTMTDVAKGEYKVDILARAITESGLHTRVIPIRKNLFHPEVVRRLSQCDIIFGCMDSYDGRELLNRLCASYNIPYFDLGVKLQADGRGGVDQVCGTVHYMQPDGSSLLSRRVITPEKVRSAALYRSNPEQYKHLLKDKYIEGIQEERPAVISVNTLIASLAVNDMLARIHPFRDAPNKDYEFITISLTQTRFVTDPESKPCPFISKYAGRGDMKPLLDSPSLSERG